MSSNEVAIKVHNVTKSYQIYNAPSDRLKQFFVPSIRKVFGRPKSDLFTEFSALNNVSFEIRKGETVGIIGRNGSGKSTLLQLICGILNPTNGTAQTFGRVAALLELGAGFNPEFTGRENVYMSCSLLGLTHKEITDKFNEITAFAGIGDFIEQPVKTYSSGMFVRLAFAVNIVSKPDVMIVDEALAVGDMNFQAKCMTAMTRLQESGATVLFVSHDIGSVKSLCSRAIYLDNGIVKAIGTAPEVAEIYIRNMREEANLENRVSNNLNQNQNLNQGTSLEGDLVSSSFHFRNSTVFDKRIGEHRYGTGSVLTRFVELLDENYQPIEYVAFNQKVKVMVHYEALEDKKLSVNVSIFDEKKNNITGCGFKHADLPEQNVKKGDKTVAEYSFNLPLQEGNYSIRVNISDLNESEDSAEFIDVVSDAIVFKVGKWDKGRFWSKVHLFPTVVLHNSVI